MLDGLGGKVRKSTKLAEVFLTLTSINLEKVLF
jgi:hypothetical protein